jgi:hypothetical protein
MHQPSTSFPKLDSTHDTKTTSPAIDALKAAVDETIFSEVFLANQMQPRIIVAHSGSNSIVFSLSTCHHLPQQDNQVKQRSKVSGGRVCTFHVPSNNFLQRALCAKGRGRGLLVLSRRWSIA